MFLLDPGTKIGNGDAVKNNLQILSRVPIETFSNRLNLLVNTYFRSSTRYSSTVGLLDDLFSETLKPGTLAAGTARVDATMTYLLPPIYVLNKVWISIYFLSAAMLVAAAIAAFFFRWKCCAPEMLGFVTSMTRDSEFFKGFNTGENSTKAGPDVSEKLAKTRVMVGDAWPNETEGRIALMPAGEGQRVRIGRFYV